MRVVVLGGALICLGRSQLEPETLFVQPQGSWLARGGCVVHTEPQVLRVLIALLARPGAILPRSELAELLWSDRRDGGPDDAVKAIDGLVLRARAAAAALGCRIDATGRGYCAFAMR
jgi:DNA-binding response OmpR family regulator